MTERRPQIGLNPEEEAKTEIIRQTLLNKVGNWFSVDTLAEITKITAGDVGRFLRDDPTLARRWPTRDKLGREFYTDPTTRMTFREHLALARLHFEWFYRKDDFEVMMRR